MSDGHGLTAENLLRTLPEVLRNDEGAYALASAIADVLSTRPGEIEGLMIYSRIGQLPENLLDMLAVDFKVDWWSPDYSLAVKRATLKDSWRVHRKLGTKYALEQAISDIYPQTVVQEWWEYGGEPYCFRIMIGNFDEVADPEKLLKIRRAISQVKRLSAHLDGIDISSAVLQVQVYAGGALPPAVTEDTISETRVEPLLARKIAVQGGHAGIEVTGVTELGREISFGGNGYSAGAFLPVSFLQLPAGGNNNILVCRTRLYGRALDMTETEVLHL